jgi:hypothetical protein
MLFRRLEIGVAFKAVIAGKAGEDYNAPQE